MNLVDGCECIIHSAGCAKRSGPCTWTWTQKCEIELKNAKWEQCSQCCAQLSHFVAPHLRHVAMAQFSNSMIHGSTINLAQGNININNSEQGMLFFHIGSKNCPYRWSNKGLHELSLAVSHGAIHDSAERHPAPNCHPDTRKAVRQIIADWIHYECWASSFFRLYGPAGAGKTTILQTIAEFLCRPSESDDNLGANFFLFQSRDQGHFLFSTIAYQLALKVPGLREHVDHIMDENPTFHTKSMDVQLQTLTVDAFHPSGFRDVPICDHRWIGWMLWQGGTTIHSPTPLRNNHSLQITTTI